MHSYNIRSAAAQGAITSRQECAPAFCGREASEDRSNRRLSSEQPNAERKRFATLVVRAALLGVEVRRASVVLWTFHHAHGACTCVLIVDGALQVVVAGLKAARAAIGVGA